MLSKENQTRNWHPVYCRLSAIMGLHEEKARCEKILATCGADEKVVLLIRASGDWLYGQCNFKFEPEDDYNLKFLDSIQTIVGRDLEIFAQGGVQKVLFIEKDLFESFEAKRDKDFETFVLQSLLVKE